MNSPAQTSRQYNRKPRHVPHKFRLGQLVRYVPPFGTRAPNVDFTIVRLLPETEYRIKAKDEPNERIARESELRPAADPDRGLWPGRRE
jgi:hypothetical protein